MTLPGTTKLSNSAAFDELDGVLAALFQFAPDAMLLVDPAGRILRVNERTELMLGYAPDDLVGKRIEVLVPMHLRKSHVQHRGSYHADPHRREMGAGLPLAARRKDGTEFPVDIMLSPLETAAGQCAIATMRDVTERKRIEGELSAVRDQLESKVLARTAELAFANAALRRDAERLSTIIATQRQLESSLRHHHTAMELIVERTQQLFEADGAAIDLLEQDEFVARSAVGITTIHVPVWLKIASFLARECFRTGEIFQCDDTESDPRLDAAACRKVGMRSILVIPFDHDGSAAGVLKIVSKKPAAFHDRDVRIATVMTGLISSTLNNAALHESRKLASLAVVASGVAHEIRNPLTAIKARLYTHEKRLTAGSPEAEDTAFISEEIGRLERIVREFLQFARPGDPHFAPTSPEELLKEVCELLTEPLKQKGILLEIGETVRTPVRADRQQIKQVLINLVRNASESIGHDGRIMLRARQRRIGLGGSVLEAVTMEIKDNGPGIPADVQKQIFDPFFTTKASGTGLGLSTAARIVQQHGGALRFTTTTRGTTFRLVLPVAPAQ